MNYLLWQQVEKKLPLLNVTIKSDKVTNWQLNVHGCVLLACPYFESAYRFHGDRFENVYSFDFSPIVLTETFKLLYGVIPFMFKQDIEYYLAMKYFQLHIYIEKYKEEYANNALVITGDNFNEIYYYLKDENPAIKKQLIQFASYNLGRITVQLTEHLCDKDFVIQIINNGIECFHEENISKFIKKCFVTNKNVSHKILNELLVWNKQTSKEGHVCIFSEKKTGHLLGYNLKSKDCYDFKVNAKSMVIHALNKQTVACLVEPSLTEGYKWQIITFCNNGQTRVEEKTVIYPYTGHSLRPLYVLYVKMLTRTFVYKGDLIYLHNDTNNKNWTVLFKCSNYQNKSSLEFYCNEHMCIRHDKPTSYISHCVLEEFDMLLISISTHSKKLIEVICVDISDICNTVITTIFSGDLYSFRLSRPLLQRITENQVDLWLTSRSRYYDTKSSRYKINFKIKNITFLCQTLPGNGTIKLHGCPQRQTQLHMTVRPLELKSAKFYGTKNFGIPGQSVCYMHDTENAFTALTQRYVMTEHFDTDIFRIQDIEKLVCNNADAEHEETTERNIPKQLLLSPDTYACIREPFLLVPQTLLLPESHKICIHNCSH